MIRRMLTAALIVAVTIIVAVLPRAASATTPTYYLALGDSLSVGLMPGQRESDQGYADDYYASLKTHHPGLQLVKLGCPGETSESLIDGGPNCSYPGAASQLVAAENFFQQHPSAVSFISLDIGINDVGACIATGVDPSCALRAASGLVTNTATIMRRLRIAGGLHPIIVGLNLYDPLLVEWLSGVSGQTTARVSAPLLATLNGALSATFTTFGARTADVASAFDTYDFGNDVELPGIGPVPANVAALCTLTFMCSQHNIHPDPAGYQRIASAMVSVAR
ncbi:GDSL-like Lipase/Acylhydrolase family protein [Frankineae bacterium MT45]|nr:GDSL-like Lipase/Acylhydrolase family protein [Frankineae bacterium MT45]